MDSIRILFTSVGRRVELMQAFQEVSKKEGTKVIIYGADMSKTAPALFFCNRAVRTCSIKDEKYIPQLLKLCEDEKIDLLIPTIDTDLLILAENKKKFAEIGTKVLVSNIDKVKICRDKRLTSNFFVSCGLKAPLPVDNYLDYCLDFPAFIKPRDGSSSINAYRVNSEIELNARAELMTDYIVQPFVSGKEYTVDILCDFDSNPVFITPRERLAVRSGEVLITKIVQDSRIIEECKSIIKEFKPIGQITVQLIRDEVSNDDFFIEINPRFGGGAPLSIKAGADSAEAIIKMSMGEKNISSAIATDGAVYSRFDQSICIGLGQKPRIKAVIFDLDDTIYSEKEYVKSGFQAINKEIGIPFEKLWNAYEHSQSPIDTVLYEMNIIEKKQECLEIYRNHKPDIKEYPGIRDLINKLRQRGIFVGIVTDGRPEGQNAKLQALGLNVDKVVITDELGGPEFRKPCDIAFRIMQRSANVDFSKMVYIGDNLGKDFIAPKQLGMQSIFFDNQDGIYSDYEVNEQQIACVNSISELIELLEHRVE